MRRIEGLMFETVVVRRDGSGQVGHLIGEISGTHYQSFQLRAVQLARLRRLVAGAGHAAHPLRVVPSSTPTITYLVRTTRWNVEAAAGHVPRPLAGLVGTLSGLIDRY
jgi:hypothetical protein